MSVCVLICKFPFLIILISVAQYTGTYVYWKGVEQIPNPPPFLAAISFQDHIHEAFNIQHTCMALDFVSTRAYSMVCASPPQMHSICHTYVSVIMKLSQP